MPNWVKNIVRIAGPEQLLEDFKEYAASEKDSFDFAKIVPMPEDLQIESGSSGENGLRLLYREEDDPEERRRIEDAYRSVNPFFRKITDSDAAQLDGVPEEKKAAWKELAKRYLFNYGKYGHCTWYTWSYENWGTKWPAYAEEPSFVHAGEASYLEYIFTTAWSAPIPVFRAALLQHPALEFRGAYADEDTGSGNTGVWYRARKDLKVLPRSETFAESVWSYPEEETERFP